MVDKRSLIKRKIEQSFSDWYSSEGLINPQRSINYKKTTTPDITEGAVYTKVKKVTFNPRSRQHIHHVLKTKYNWKPTQFTEKGQPKIDETVLAGLDYPEAKILNSLLLIQKRIDQLSEGKKSWLKLLSDESFIHGAVNPNGAVTGRATHSSPNIAQVPGNHAVYGKRCRELFTVPQGWVLLGADVSGLELRCLAHYLFAYDKGKYRDVLLKADIHTANQKAAGLGTRDLAKTFIYCFLYGGGHLALGKILAPKANETEQRKAGRIASNKFLKSLPALKTLIERAKKASKKGWIKGLDGRKLFIRSEHSALNTLLQSAGALICKKWLVEVEKIAIQLGYKHGWDGDFVYCAWVHDELQIAVKPELADKFGQIAIDAIKNVERIFKLKCPLDAEYKIGKNWSETH